MKKNIFTIYLLLFSSFLYAQNLQEIYKEAQKFYENKQYPDFLASYKKLDSIRPMHPTILYNLAAAYALNQQSKNACESLEKLFLINATPRIEADSDFDMIRQSADFQKVIKKLHKIRKVINNSKTHFQISEKDAHIESIAYDKQTNSFFCGSVHKNKILIIDEHRQIRDFSSPNDSLYAVLGIQIDQKRRILWAVSSATKEMQGFSDDKEGKAMLCKYDLDKSELVGKYTLNDSNPHFFGDLILDKNGNPYLSDSSYPAIYKLNPQTQNLELFLKTDLLSLQGMAFSADENLLYFADYVKGIFVYLLDNQQLTPLKLPADISMKGTDGLYFYKNSLIAIQNGIEPKRVIRLFLGKDNTVKKYKILESNNVLFQEPTLGTIIDDEFYYVANSSWGAYDKDGKLNTDLLQNIHIFKLKLK